MIGVTGENRERPIDLLGRHDAHQLVRPGHGTEREDEIGFGAEVGIESVGTADDETDLRHALIAVATELGGKLRSRKTFAALVAGDAPARRAEHRANRFCFLALSILWTARAALLYLAVLDIEPDSAPCRRGAFEIALDQLPFRAGLGSSDRDEKKTHRGSARVPLAGPISAPHLLEVVELAHLGTEQMHDHVAGIDQNPVAMRQPFDARASESGILDPLDHTFRDRSHMHAGASGGDDHGIGEGSLAMQVEADDVFCFGIFETRQNGLGEKAGVRFSRTLRRGKR